MAQTGTANITGLNTAKTLGTIPALTQRALIQPVAQAVYVEFSGGTPSDTVGLLLGVGEIMEIEGIALASVKVIEAAASASLKVVFLDGVGSIKVFK
jgi:proteasome assembly chaperone (PAC2) family protein